MKRRRRKEVSWTARSCQSMSREVHHECQSGVRCCLTGNHEGAWQLVRSGYVDPAAEGPKREASQRLFCVVPGVTAVLAFGGELPCQYCLRLLRYRSIR